MSDFDITIESGAGAAVVGKYDAPNIWSACACQESTVGAQGVVKFTYPAKVLAQTSRIAGVAFTTQSAFTISAGKTKYNPSGCAALAAAAALPAVTVPNRGVPVAAPVVAAGGAPRSPVVSGGVPIPASNTPAPVAAPSAPPLASGRSAPAPLTSAPAATTTAIIKDRYGVSPKAGEGAPINLTVTGTVTGVRVSFNWGDANESLVDVVLYRKDGAQLSTLRGSLASLGGGSTPYFDDVLTDNSVSYVFTIFNVYADGTRAESAPASWAFPALVNPSGFSATDKGEGTVGFNWGSVAGAMRYRLDGPGVPNTGLIIDDTTASVKAAPHGQNTWKLVAMYPANFADYSKPSVASLIVRVMPPHAIPWLSKKNGPGSDSIANAHFAEVCTHSYAGETTTYSCQADLDRELKSVPDAVDFYGKPKFQAVYGNPTDLGFGRRTSCAQGLAPPPGFLTTICWTTSHGPGAGEPGFADPQVITDAAAQNALIRTTTMIIKDQTGMRFLVFGPPTGGGGYDDAPSAPSHYILLDTQGKKFAPHTCMSCHGGTYEPIANRVVGATMQPLNPSELVYQGGPSGRAAQEESIRKINQYVLGAGPSAAVAAYINGLYGGNVSVPGAKALTDYVPSGWSSQPGLYRQVVRPYCSTCHMAADPGYSFASWGNFQGNAALINAAVCGAHSMPHAELPFKEFWTKNTGIIYLPGVLAAALGYPSC